MLKRISSSVYCWSELHGEARNQPYNWNSYLIHVREKNVLALVDPLPLSADEIREIKELGMPTHILLTCNFHLGESERYRQKWDCKIYINQLGLEDSEVPIDGTFQDRDRLWNFVDIIHIPDIYFSDEVALLVREEKGIQKRSGYS